MEYQRAVVQKSSKKGVVLCCRHTWNISGQKRAKVAFGISHQTFLMVGDPTNGTVAHNS